MVWALLAAASTGLAAVVQEEPETIVVSDTVSCEECRIEFEHVVRLGGETPEEGLLCGGSDLAVAADRFYVSECKSAAILVFDRNGVLLNRFGRRGQGPGELLGHRLMLRGMPDGGVLVFSGNRRASRFGADLELIYEGDQAGTYPLDAVVMSDGTTVESYLDRTPELFGYPLHVVDSLGRDVRSIGSHDEPIDLRRQSMETLVRMVGLDRSGERVWSARHNEYRIELLDSDLDGTVKRVVVRDGWFEPWMEKRAGSPSTYDLFQDEDGLLWVVLRRSGFEPTSLSPHGYRFVVEAIDVDAGTLLATRTMDPESGLPRVAGRYAWRIMQDGTDEFVDVFRMRVVR